MKIPKKIQEEVKHLQESGIPRCPHCHKDYENAFDTKTKKISKYLWKPTCKCIKHPVQLAMG